MPRKGMRSVFFNPDRGTPSTTVPPSPRGPTFSTSMMEEDVSNAEAIIIKWDPGASNYARVTSLFYESRAEARRFLRAVGNLQRAMQFFIADSSISSSPVLARAQIAMQSAMKRLEKEFYQILSANRDCLDPDSVSARTSLSSYYTEGNRSSISFGDETDDGDDEISAADVAIREVENVPAAAMADLRTIAECMISAGYGRECFEIYKIMRRSIIDEGLYKLGFESLTPSKIQKMDWEVLELHIKSWLGAARIAVRSLFPGERALCDFVFAGPDFIRESCFDEIAGESAAHFLAFSELVAQTKRSPEKVFRILDLYETFAELWPEIEAIFHHKTTSVVRSQAVSSLLKLGEVVRATIADFEAAIQKDASKKAVLGGKLHPLTLYVMNYMAFLADYKGVLLDIFADYPLPVNTPLLQSFVDKSALSPESSPSTPSTFSSLPPSSSLSDRNPTAIISARFSRLILVLLCKLDRKTESYRNTALSYLYLANNLQCIVNKVRESKLSQILGDDWVAMHEGKARMYAGNYERLAWEKVAAAIPENPAAVVEVETAKKWMRQFNHAFKEMYRKQVWSVVTDGPMRDQLKASTARRIVPAYRAFYERCRVLLRGEIDSVAVVRFTPENLANYLSDHFYGPGSSDSGLALTSASTSPDSTKGNAVMHDCKTKYKNCMTDIASRMKKGRERKGSRLTVRVKLNSFLCFHF